MTKSEKYGIAFFGGFAFLMLWADYFTPIWPHDRRSVLLGLEVLWIAVIIAARLLCKKEFFFIAIAITTSLCLTAAGAMILRLHQP